MTELYRKIMKQFKITFISPKQFNLDRIIETEIIFVKSFMKKDSLVKYLNKNYFPAYTHHETLIAINNSLIKDDYLIQSSAQAQKKEETDWKKKHDKLQNKIYNTVARHYKDENEYIDTFLLKKGCCLNKKVTLSCCERITTYLEESREKALDYIENSENITTNTEKIFFTRFLKRLEINRISVKPKPRKARNLIKKVETPKVEETVETPKVEETVETPKVEETEETDETEEINDIPHYQKPKVIEPIEVVKREKHNPMHIMSPSDLSLYEKLDHKKNIERSITDEERIKYYSLKNKHQEYYLYTIYDPNTRVTRKAGEYN